MDKIIEARGCVVQDENLRTGRRGDALRADIQDEWRKLRNDGICKRKPRSRQRKATADRVAETRPIHPDMLTEFANLCSVPDEQNDLFLQADNFDLDMYNDDNNDDDD